MQTLQRFPELVTSHSKGDKVQKISIEGGKKSDI